MADESSDELIPKDLLEDYAEVGISDLIEQAKPYVPLLDHIGTSFPIVRTALAAIKLPRNLSDIILGKKVNIFLYSSGITEQKLETLRNKFSESKQNQLWEQVVLAINSHDDTRRTEITGKLFSSLIDGYLSEDEFFTLVHTTNIISLALLDDLLQIYMLSDEGPYLKTSIYYALITAGLVDLQNGITGTWDGETGPSYPLNQIGWKYAGIIFDYPASNVANVLVGKSELISFIGENGLPTGKAFPLKTMKDERKRYGIADIFLLKSGGFVLCEEDSCKPVIILSSPIPAGSEALGETWKLIETENLSHLFEVRLFIADDPPVQKHAFTVIGDFRPAHTRWMEINRIRQELIDISDPDEHILYLQAVAEQIERHLNEPGLPPLFG
jgi:hypothetical protein